MLKEGSMDDTICPLNVRCFEGIGELIGREGPNGESSSSRRRGENGDGDGDVQEGEGGRLRIRYYDGRNRGREYLVT